MVSGVCAGQPCLARVVCPEQPHKITHSEDEKALSWETYWSGQQSDDSNPERYSAIMFMTIDHAAKEHGQHKWRQLIRTTQVLTSVQVCIA